MSGPAGENGNSQQIPPSDLCQEDRVNAHHAFYGSDYPLPFLKSDDQNWDDAVTGYNSVLHLLHKLRSVQGSTDPGTARDSKVVLKSDVEMLKHAGKRGTLFSKKKYEKQYYSAVGIANLCRRTPYSRGPGSRVK